MAKLALREIIEIDEDLCDGCGECIPNCEEGALVIVDGKAKLGGRCAVVMARAPVWGPVLEARCGSSNAQRRRSTRSTYRRGQQLR